MSAADSNACPSMPEEVKSMILDCIGHEQWKSHPEDTVDTLYFQDMQPKVHNRMYQEMMQYFRRHYGTLEEVEQHLQRINCDLLEVYCSQNSELTNHGNGTWTKGRSFLPTTWRSEHIRG